MPESPDAWKISYAFQCPHEENHTALPSTYLKWENWLRAMKETRRLAKCPDCGFYVIWVRR